MTTVTESVACECGRTVCVSVTVALDVAVSKQDKTKPTKGERHAS